MNENIKGWYNLSCFEHIGKVAIEPRRATGMSVSIAEMGVFWGRFAINATNEFLKDGETFLAVDCFDTVDKNSGVDPTLTEEAFRRKYEALTEVDAKLEVLVGDTKEMDYKDYNVYSVNGYTVISIDGAHDRDSAFHDMTEAAKCLSPDGIMVIDDVFNPHWPGVQVALNDFLRQNTDMTVLAIVSGVSIVCNKIYSSRKASLLPKGAMRTERLPCGRVAIYG